MHRRLHRLAEEEGLHSLSLLSSKSICGLFLA
jgi:hypothetical protein